MVSLNDTLTKASFSSNPSDRGDVKSSHIFDTGGWMFTVNGKIPNVGANQVKLNKDDKVIWFCTYDYKRDKAPSWEELIVGQGIDKIKLEEALIKGFVLDVERLNNKRDKSF